MTPTRSALKVSRGKQQRRGKKGGGGVGVEGTITLPWKVRVGVDGWDWLEREIEIEIEKERTRCKHYWHGLGKNAVRVAKSGLVKVGRQYVRSVEGLITLPWKVRVGVDGWDWLEKEIEIEIEKERRRC
jgi:hypothetical protein